MQKNMGLEQSSLFYRTFNAFHQCCTLKAGMSKILQKAEISEHCYMST